jgi:hypothetical protein
MFLELLGIVLSVGGSAASEPRWGLEITRLPGQVRCCSLEQIARCRFGWTGLSFGRWRTN